jgi:hypothetical protein
MRTPATTGARGSRVDAPRDERGVLLDGRGDELARLRWALTVIGDGIRTAVGEKLTAHPNHAHGRLTKHVYSRWTNWSASFHVVQNAGHERG